MSEKVQGHVGIAQIDGAALTLGQKPAAASIPVVLPSDGTLPLGTGAATAAKQDEQTTLLTNIAGYVDGLEGLVDGLEGFVDGLEGALAAGISTATKQDTGNASLASIDGKMTACNTGAVTISAALPAGANAIGKLAANTGVIIGAVEIAAAQTVAVTNAGTFVVQVDGTALTRLTDIETNTDSLAVVGNGAAATAQRVTLANDSTGILAGVTTVSTLTGGGVAHDGVDSGNPIKTGARAVSTLSTATLVSAADRADNVCDLDGAQIVRPFAPLGDNVSGVAAITDGSSTSVIAAQGSGVKTYVTDIVIANTSATAVTVDLRDGAAGSVKMTIPVPANTAGVVINLSRPLAFSADTAVCADPSAAASTVTVTLNAFKSKI